MGALCAGPLVRHAGCLLKNSLNETEVSMADDHEIVSAGSECKPAGGNSYPNQFAIFVFPLRR